MALHYLINCPTCATRFNPHTMSSGMGNRAKILRGIESLCRRVRHLHDGDGEPEAERLLTKAHNLITDRGGGVGSLRSTPRKPLAPCKESHPFPVQTRFPVATSPGGHYGTATPLS